MACGQWDGHESNIPIHNIRAFLPFLESPVSPLRRRKSFADSGLNPSSILGPGLIPNLDPHSPEIGKSIPV
jgi:hypothetical protein